MGIAFGSTHATRAWNGQPVNDAYKTYLIKAQTAFQRKIEDAIEAYRKSERD